MIDYQKHRDSLRAIRSAKISCIIFENEVAEELLNKAEKWDQYIISLREALGAQQKDS